MTHPENPVPAVVSGDLGADLELADPDRLGPLPLDAWLRQRESAVVAELARAAFAGARVLVAPTRRTSEAALEATGFAFRAAALTARVVELAREAGDLAGDDLSPRILVAGEVGGRATPYVRREAAEADLRVQTARLAQTPADIAIVRTTRLSRSSTSIAPGVAASASTGAPALAIELPRAVEVAVAELEFAESKLEAWAAVDVLFEVDRALAAPGGAVPRADLIERVAAGCIELAARARAAGAAVVVFELANANASAGAGAGVTELAYAAAEVLAARGAALGRHGFLVADAIGRGEVDAPPSRAQLSARHTAARIPQWAARVAALAAHGAEFVGGSDGVTSRHTAALATVVASAQAA